MISKSKFFELYNRNSYKNKNKEIGTIANRLFRRNLALHTSYILAKIGISANSVTIGFLIISLIANGLFIIPNFYTIIILIVASEIAQILDCVDGQLARYHGTSSTFGKLLDIFSEVIIWGTFFIAFGSRLYLENGNPFFLILGSLGTLSLVTESLWVKSTDSLVGSLNSRKNSLMRTIRIIYINLEDITLISVAVLILQAAEAFTGVNWFVESFFILHVIFEFTIKIVARMLITISKANSVQKKDWMGWQ